MLPQGVQNLPDWDRTQEIIFNLKLFQMRMDLDLYKLILIAISASTRPTRFKGSYQARFYSLSGLSRLDFQRIMDGVSGVLAMASFSIQLVETVQKARKFLKEVRTASEELERLVDALDQFESLLIAANGIVERQNKIGSLSGAVNVIDNALLRCRTTVEKLDTSVNAIKAHFNVQGHGRKAWASFKAVAKKEEVKNLLRQVQENMTNLQTALLLNTSCLQ